MKIRNHIKTACVVLGFFLSGTFSEAKNDDSDRNQNTHAVGINSRPSYIMPTHGFYNGWNPMERPLRAGGSCHLDYSFSYTSDSSIGRMFPGAYQGGGIGVQTFGSHKYIGTPAMLYLFQGAPLFNLSDRLSLGYEWNFGISGLWKTNECMITGSPINLYINVGLIFTWRINPDWDFTFGPEYTHYSDGDTKFPNAGANTINFRIGTRRVFNRKSIKPERPTVFSSDERELDFLQRITYDLTLFGGWRADRMLVDHKLHIINKAFPTAGLHFNPLYHFNHSLSLGPSLDCLYDRSSNLNASIDENGSLNYSYPGFLSQFATGLSIRGELKMPIFAVNIGIGYNICQKQSELRGIYGIFALKAFMSESLFFSVGYRLGTVLYAHNLMFGLGWRFAKD